MRSSTSLLRRLRRFALPALVLFPLFTAAGPSAADVAFAVPGHKPFLLTGTSTVTGRGLPKESKRVSYRATMGATGYDLSELLGPDLTGASTTDFTARNYVLTFDPAALAQLGGQLQGRIQAALGGLKMVQVTVTAGTGSVTWDSDRTRRRLAATFLLDVTVDGGPVKKAKCRVKCSGAGRRTRCCGPA